jgi:hypothetical protein
VKIFKNEPLAHGGGTSFDPSRVITAHRRDAAEEGSADVRPGRETQIRRDRIWHADFPQ